MKTLFVIDSMASGGAQRILINVVETFRQKNIEVTVFLYQPKEDFFLDRLQSMGARVIKLSRQRDGFSLLVVIELIRLYWQKFDCIFSFQPTANIYCILARVFSPTSRVICCEFSTVNSWTSQKKRLIANLANFLSSKIICNSFTQKKYLASFPGLNNKTLVAWNGYDLATFNRRDYRSTEFTHFSIIGRIAYPKNGLNLLRGIQLFYEKMGYVPYVEWVGRRDFDPESVKMYTEMVNFLEHHPAIKHQWTWRGEIEDIGQIYLNTDCVILPSAFEGLPNVVCEAMIVGCPVLASNVSDIPILLGKNERGLVFEPLQASDICRALIEFERLSLDERRAMVERAHSYAEEHFDLIKMTNIYHDVIKNEN